VIPPPPREGGFRCSVNRPETLCPAAARRPTPSPSGETPWRRSLLGAGAPLLEASMDPAVPPIGSAPPPLRPQSHPSSGFTGQRPGRSSIPSPYLHIRALREGNFVCGTGSRCIFSLLFSPGKERKQRKEGRMCSSLPSVWVFPLPFSPIPTTTSAASSLLPPPKP
jgi:hypothetical protein